MPSWSEIERAAPELAAKVRESFESGRHKTLATLRVDGSPRISGTECEFSDGMLRFGSMPDARKLDDLRRDGRFALHGPTFHTEVGDEQSWPGEAKVSGRAIPAGPIVAEGSDEPAGEWFEADIDEVVFTGLNEAADMLVIEFWTAAGGLQVVERA